ncbi:MAG TPA: hypothetical protein VED46_02845 [Alphaproteobacteria bacterium]|nr:hypothetical protein [Alphaproteobacteria bacterium]
MSRVFTMLFTMGMWIVWANPSFAHAYGDRDFWWHPGWGWGQTPRQTPLKILQERFAKEEVDKEEYEERKRLLSG